MFFRLCHQCFFDSAIHVGCFSHTIDHVGENFDFPELDTFFSLFTNCLARSTAARQVWKQLVGTSPPTDSDTRWWSRWEIMAYVLKHWSKLPDFLSELQHHCPAFRKGLQKNFTEQNTVILLQLTAIVEVGEAFVQATYILEGDGPLSIYAWRIILGLQLHCAQVKASLPRTQRVAEQLPGAAPNTIESHMKTIRAGIEPALTYFDQKFSVDLRTAMVCFEAFDLCNPINICHMSSAVVAEKLNKLHGINMKFLTSQHVLQLRAELPAFVAQARDMDVDVDVLHWFKQRCKVIPAWSAYFKKVVIIAPSSAASERVFSVLRRVRDSDQDTALFDATQVAVMGAFNGRKEKPWRMVPYRVGSVFAQTARESPATGAAAQSDPVRQGVEVVPQGGAPVVPQGGAHVAPANVDAVVQASIVPVHGIVVPVNPGPSVIVQDAVASNQVLPDVSAKGAADIGRGADKVAQAKVSKKKKKKPKNGGPSVPVNDRSIVSDQSAHASRQVRSAVVAKKVVTIVQAQTSNPPRQPEVQDSGQGPVTPVRQGRKGRKPQKKKNDQNWVACDSCDKWRTIEFEWVDAKTFKCSFVAKLVKNPMTVQIPNACADRRKSKECRGIWCYKG